MIIKSLQSGHLALQVKMQVGTPTPPNGVPEFASRPQTPAACKCTAWEAVHNTEIRGWRPDYSFQLLQLAWPSPRLLQATEE